MYLQGLPTASFYHSGRKKSTQQTGNDSRIPGIGSPACEFLRQEAEQTEMRRVIGSFAAHPVCAIIR